MDHFLFNFAFGIPSAAYNWHFVHDYFFMGMHEIAIWYWTWNVRDIVRFGVVFMFLFLSGISCSFSKNNKERFLKLSAAGAIVTLVTFGLESIMPSSHRDFDFFIIFGILHMMAFCVGAFILIELVFKRWTKFAVLPVGAMFFIMGFFIPFWDLRDGVEFMPNLNNLDQYYWLIAISFLLVMLFMLFFVKSRKKFKKWKSFKFKLIFYFVWAAATFTGTFLLLFMLPVEPTTWQTVDELLRVAMHTGRIGADYYGIFPHMGIFLLGAGLGGFAYKNKKSLLPWIDGRWNKTFSFVGRNAIWMYLAHQVVFFVGTAVMAMLVGYRFF